MLWETTLKSLKSCYLFIYNSYLESFSNLNLNGTNKILSNNTYVVLAMFSHVGTPGYNLDITPKMSNFIKVWNYCFRSLYTFGQPSCMINYIIQYCRIRQPQQQPFSFIKHGTLEHYQFEHSMFTGWRYHMSRN